MLYSVTSPFGPLSFRAPNQTVATIVTIFIGEGWFISQAVDENTFEPLDLPAIPPFRASGNLGEFWETLGCGTNIKTAPLDHATDVIAALDSVACVSVEGRKDYETTLAESSDQSQLIKQLYHDDIPGGHVYSVAQKHKEQLIEDAKKYEAVKKEKLAS